MPFCTPCGVSHIRFLMSLSMRYRPFCDVTPTATTNRTFGTLFRNSSVVIPDDIPGLPSTHYLGSHLATDPDTLLYEAEIDNGRAWRCVRFVNVLWICPCAWVYVCSKGLGGMFKYFTCDEGKFRVGFLWACLFGSSYVASSCSCYYHCLSHSFPLPVTNNIDRIAHKQIIACCWTRKEYSTRTFYRVFPNRIELNNPHVRFPWGFCGCGSWNADAVLAHPFDRGAFGFRKVKYGVINYLCLIWPVYGDAVARQRCPCNGPLWRGGWWCEEW